LTVVAKKDGQLPLEATGMADIEKQKATNEDTMDENGCPPRCICGA
jgi:hypothetical protein